MGDDGMEAAPEEQGSPASAKIDELIAGLNELKSIIDGEESAEVPTPEAGSIGGGGKYSTAPKGGMKNMLGI
jgi:hypothetical protein